MPLRLFNTLTGRTEPFEPIKPGEATFYSCGPTVYDFAHIGNFRSFLAADVLRRWLESPLGPGLKVRQVMNITDVGHLVDDAALDSTGEDRMETARKRLLEDKKSGKLPADVAAKIDPSSPYAIADYYAACFIEDARLLGMKVVQDADAAVAAAGGDEKARDAIMPRPTRMVREMLEMIVELLRRGHAYQVAGVVYFDTQTFPDYGKLSGNTLDKIRSGAGGRVSDAAQAAKKHPADFMLWKADPTHLMRWDPAAALTGASRDDAQRFGLREGYPGWHIECSAMAKSRLGEVIDLHSGGEDNIFPHHECEIAQSRCANGPRGHEPAHFSRFWFHPRFLQVEGAKMSKSKGNFYTVRDLVGKGFSPAAIRLELIKTHYRSNANFTEQGLRDSERRIARWRKLAAHVESGHATFVDQKVSTGMIRGIVEQFVAAMNDDLNVSLSGASLDLLLKQVATAPAAQYQSGEPMVNGIRAVQVDIDTLIPDPPVAIPQRPMDPLEAQHLLDRGMRNNDPCETLKAALHLFDDVLGVVFVQQDLPSSLVASPEDARIDELVRRRTEARKSKNWAESDKIRDELAALGIVVTDSPTGPTWSRKAKL